MVISTCISHIPYFILWNSEVFWSFSLVFRILFFFLWNSEVFWASSLIFSELFFFKVEFRGLLGIFPNISHVAYFISFPAKVSWSYSLVFRILFSFKWNSEVFWSFSPVFLDYSSEASRTNHRFYEISLFCQFGFTVFS